MSLMLARGLGYAARRFAPRLFRSAYRSYASNPNAWHNGYRVARAAGAGAILNAAGHVVSPRTPANVKRRAELSPKAAKRVAKNLSKDMEGDVQMGGTAKSRGGVGNGVYRGSIFKSRRRAKPKKTVDFSKFGIKQTIEEYGDVDDNDTVYIMTPCANDVKVLETVIASLIKKLLIMGIKWSAPSVTEEILYGPGAGTLNPTGLFINLYGGRPDTTDTNYNVVKAYSLGDGDSIWTVVAQFIQPFTQYTTGTLDIGGTVNVNNEIYSIVLGSQVRNALDNGGVQQTLAVIYFDEEMVHWKGSSRIKLQNRTNSVTSSTSTDVNDAKPLEGFAYEFKGLPRLRNIGTGDYRTIDSGLNTKTFGAATVPNDFKEPPPSRIFANCKGKKRIRLDPGQIKEHNCYGSGSMQFKVFLKRLVAEESLSLTIHTMFKTAMYAFEELINSTDVNAVKVGFENSVNLAITLATKKKKIVTMPYYRAINIVETT